MLVQIPESDIKYLKEVIPAFCNIGAYVHEGVRITVDYDSSAETHEACENLIEFRGRYIYPEYIEALNSIFMQIIENMSKTGSLKDQLNELVNLWFYNKQEELGITDGAEPFDSNIQTLEEQLVNECERVLEWQKSFVKKVNDDGTIELNINGRIFVGKFKEE